METLLLQVRQCPAEQEARDHLPPGVRSHIHVEHVGIVVSACDPQPLKVRMYGVAPDAPRGRAPDITDDLPGRHHGVGVIAVAGVVGPFQPPAAGVVHALQGRRIGAVDHHEPEGRGVIRPARRFQCRQIQADRDDYPVQLHVGRHRLAEGLPWRLFLR